MQTYGVNSAGGFLSVPDLSKRMLVQSQQRTILRQFVTPLKAFGAKMSNTFFFDRAGNVSTAGSTTGIDETLPVPETQIPFTQGSILVTEYANSIRHTGKVSALSTISIEDASEEALLNDQRKTTDLAVRTVIRSTDIKIKYSFTGTAASPTSTIGVGGTGVAFTRDGQAWDVRELVGYMDNTLYAPGYEGDTWVILTARDGFHRAVQESSNWTDVAIRQDGGRRIFKGEVGEYSSARFVTETNAFSTKLNGFRGEFAMFSQEGIYEAIVIAPQIRMKETSDYKRDQGLAWYGIMGWNECWDTSTGAKIIHGFNA